MRAICLAVGTSIFAVSCTTSSQTSINVDGREYVASFEEMRDPVTNDLIEVRYLVTEFDIECGSRAECEPLIREAEAARAAEALEQLQTEATEEIGEPISAVEVEVTPLEDSPEPASE